MQRAERAVQQSSRGAWEPQCRIVAWSSRSTDPMAERPVFGYGRGMQAAETRKKSTVSVFFERGKLRGSRKTCIGVLRSTDD